MAKLILIGFMGSGKTTIGYQLAKKLSIPQLDLDALIVQQTNQSINDIFAEAGEKYFRKVETRALKKAIDRNVILSTGGGTPINKINRILLKSVGAPIVFLSTEFGTIEKRINQDNNRPLVKKTNEFRRRYIKRYRVYHALADIEIITDGKKPEVIVETILEKLL
ncbi:shikimate kinase [Oenococcus sp. UCMA 16435]|nr:shikimate kinase [Oenococcus sp. UCMA 16435]MDI4584404.1 AAA family ATPase [Oenococcus sp. UCMA 14587]